MQLFFVFLDASTAVECLFYFGGLVGHDYSIEIEGDLASHQDVAEAVYLRLISARVIPKRQ